MKKHYKGLTVLLSACMLAGSASVAYAGPADDIANGTVGMPNTGSSTSAEQFNQGTGQQDLAERPGQQAQAQRGQGAVHAAQQPRFRHPPVHPAYR